MGTFSEKKLFCLLVPPKQKSFLTISNENIFSRTSGARLSGKVATKKGLEQALNMIFVIMVNYGCHINLFSIAFYVLMRSSTVMKSPNIS